MRRGISLLTCLLLAPVAVAAGGGDPVADVVREALMARSAWMSGDLELVVLGRPGIPQTGVQLRVGDIAGRWPRARVAVPVAHWKDGVLLRTQTVWVAVNWWRELDVYAQDHAAGTGATAVRHARVRFDFAGIDGEPISAGALDADLRLARPVRRGRPLVAADFEPMPAVRRGDEVHIEVVRGAIALRTRGRALADGWIGDPVKVVLGEGRAPVNTRVMSSRAVRLED